MTLKFLPGDLIKIDRNHVYSLYRRSKTGGKMYKQASMESLPEGFKRAGMGIWRYPDALAAKPNKKKANQANRKALKSSSP